MKVPKIDPWRVAAMLLAIVFIISYWNTHPHPLAPQQPTRLEKVK